MLGVERIKQSVEKVLDELFSGQHKQATPEYDPVNIAGLIAKEVDVPKEVST